MFNEDIVVPMQESHNLASWIHKDKELHKELTHACPNYMGAFNRYTEIGSDYCPRVLQACESMLLYLHGIGTKYQYSKYTSTSHPMAFIK